MWFPLLAAAMLQQQSAPPSQARPPIASVVVQPSEAAIQVGDTIRLAAMARDSVGRPVRDVVIRWFQSGGHFEGTVDSTGLVTGGGSFPTPRTRGGHSTGTVSST